MSNKIHVVYEGVSARVYLPDGTELKGVLSVKVNTPHPRDGTFASLCIEVADFSVEQDLTKPD